MMQNRLKTILLIFFLSIIIINFFLFINFNIGNDRFKNLKSLLGNEQKLLIKKYLFTDKYIQEFTDKYIQEQSASVHKLELNFKEKNFEIETVQSYVNLSNNRTLKKIKLTNGFYAGINNTFPGSGYIDFSKNKILVLSGSGVLVFKNNMEDSKENFQQIKNNIHEYIGINQFQKHNWFSLKDMLIYDNKIFVSYTEEMQKDCWNISIIYGDMNFENIKFEKLFSPKECVHSTNNVDKEFNAHQSGGRMISYDDNHILLTIGDFRNRHLSQNKESVNGKIIKINIDNYDYKIISMGHRNVQGLHFDKENNFMLATEHGPKGGDEINLIDVNKIKNNKILNYGWAISSAGEHYSDSGGGKGLQKLYEKYPLYKSHREHGFIEPLKSFVPSIGISEIVSIAQNKYVVSSLLAKSLYFFSINEERQITNFNTVEVFERVRDLVFNNNKLYLFMESTASIGIIDLN